MLALVTRTCPRWLVDQAEDIVQTAMLGVLEHRRKSGGGHEVSSSYLMRAAHNALIDEVRRRFRRAHVTQGDASGMETARATDPAPDARASSREIDRGIRGCLALLPRPRRLAVTLYLLGYTPREASVPLGWSARKTENLVYRGLEQMRRCLSHKGFVP